jgi:hypothetical protein
MATEGSLGRVCHPGEVPGTNGDTPDADDGEEGGEARLPGPRAAYAVNWYVVLGVDAAMGLVVAIAGLVAMIVWAFWLGALLALVGCVYVATVARRAEYWSRLRRDAGL